MQRDQVIWRDGDIPQSTRFHDPYFSLADGLAETKHVFLAGNDLPNRFTNGFVVAELGFGTGLNALAMLHAWENSGQQGRFQFTSFEQYPMDANDLARALRRWPQLHGTELSEAWAIGARAIKIGAMDLQIIEGDAREMLPVWRGSADAWCLDGFAPTKNPEMWGKDLLAEVGRHTKPLGTCATYSASRMVREGLTQAGFQIERCTGFGHKRHMTRAKLV